MQITTGFGSGSKQYDISLEEDVNGEHTLRFTEIGENGVYFVVNSEDVTFVHEVLSGLADRLNKE